jgi:imidazolonepropionase-like amidohydrolase/predicted enzyme related to lactoylglutathione lyase
MTKTMLTLLALLTVVICTGCAQSVSGTGNSSITGNGTMIIKNARVIIGNGEVVPSASVVITDGRIQQVSAEDVTISGAQVIDAAGKSLMPGLIDAHMHIFYSFQTGEQAYRSLLANQAPGYMQSFLQYGVTTIKSINDPLDIVLELRQQLQDKKMPGPRLLTVGPAFTAPDGHPAISLAANDPWLRAQLTIEVDNAAAAREAVRSLAAKKIDAIKLVYQGGAMNNGTLEIQKLSEAVMQAIIDEAHKNNLRATVHVWYEQDAIDVLEAGADGLEHGLVGVHLTDNRLAELLNEKHAFFVPTLQIARTAPNKDELPIAQQNLKALSDAGVSIAMGTDMHCALQPPGAMELDELELMQQAGLTPNQIIVAATRNAAEHLGLLKDIGTIEPGKIADLILVDGDPSQNIADVRKIVYVFQAGNIVYDPKQEQEQAESKAKNAVTWFDLPVTDMNRATAFYESVLQISLASFDAGQVKFARFPDKNDANGAAGQLIQNPASKPSGQGTVVYFAVADIDAAITRIQAAGGTVVQPKFSMGDLGDVCLFLDTEGNLVGLRAGK